MDEIKRDLPANIPQKPLKVRELVGKEIMDAYNGDYLAKDFGYSCANFNVKGGFGHHNMYFFDSYGYGGGFEHDNDEATFDFYVYNPKNISCFVVYNNEGKIWGRRMFYKGPSLVSDEEFDTPIKMGDEVKYLYGYYGSHLDPPQKAIYSYAMRKYGDGIIYTDRSVLEDRRPNPSLKNYWIMGVERADFKKYPPIDFLNISTELKALTNFEPKDYIIEVLEKDHKVNNVRFHAAYRYNPSKKSVKYDYTTWDKHKGVITNMKDYTKVREEEDEDTTWVDNLVQGDTLKSKIGNIMFYVYGKSEDPTKLALISATGKEVELTKDVIAKFFDLDEN